MSLQLSCRDARVLLWDGWGGERVCHGRGATGGSDTNNYSKWYITIQTQLQRLEMLNIIGGKLHLIYPCLQFRVWCNSGIYRVTTILIKGTQFISDMVTSRWNPWMIWSLQDGIPG